MQRKTAQMRFFWRTALLLLMPFAAYALLRGLCMLYAGCVAPFVPSCVLRSFTGWLCPSCGMTHAVYALARLDLLTALHENAVIPAAVLLALLWYAELWCRALGRPRRLIPRRAWFWWGALALWMLYTVLRNFW